MKRALLRAAAPRTAQAGHPMPPEMAEASHGRTSTERSDTGPKLQPKCFRPGMTRVTVVP
jgi:hypothetical protein